MTHISRITRRTAALALSLALSASLTALGGCASTAGADSSERVRALPTHNGFDGFVRPLDGPVRLEVSLSEDLLKLADGPGPRNTGPGLRRGFATGGYLGQDALEDLLGDTTEELVDELAKRGVGIDDDSDTVLRVSIVDARPNRPTFNQLSREPSLSFNSRARGGVSFEGGLTSASTGESLGEFTYGRYDDFFQPAAAGTWTDANRGIDSFARRLSKQLTPLSGKEL